MALEILALGGDCFGWRLASHQMPNSAQQKLRKGDWGMMFSSVSTLGQCRQFSKFCRVAGFSKFSQSVPGQ